jgi:hypothetical protein
MLHMHNLSRHTAFFVLIPVFLVMCLQACVELAKSVGEMRTETELLPQCWEQVFYILVDVLAFFRI